MERPKSTSEKHTSVPTIIEEQKRNPDGPARGKKTVSKPPEESPSEPTIIAEQKRSSKKHP